MDFFVAIPVFLKLYPRENLNETLLKRRRMFILMLYTRHEAKRFWMSSTAWCIAYRLE